MSVNKVILLGNLGRDPETKTMPDGTKLVKFPLATSETYKDKSGNRVDQTEWHNIIIWRELAEIAEKYLRKGSTVYIEGKIKTRSWDQNGEKRYATDIVADSMRMVGGKKEGENNTQAPTSANPAPRMEQSSGTGGNPPMSQSGDDDLPF